MPRTKPQTVVHYTRGAFRLVKRPDRSNLEICWYDPVTKHDRFLSTGTPEIELGQQILDDKYLEVTQGVECCPTCRRPYDLEAQKRLLVLDAIERYLVVAKKKTSHKEIDDRLNHIVNYLETLPNAGVFCDEVDENWIADFRTWVGAIPVVSPAGNERQRALSTIENSVLQLAAAMRHCKQEPLFKPIPTKRVNRTPSYRASVKDLARMLNYALTPKKRRDNLLAFLRVSIVTMGRPDAVQDASTDPQRRQWDENHGIFNLNPAGRHQTKKYRATVPVARQAVWLFKNTKGFLLRGSAKKSFYAMATDLGLPAEGESGLKLIRRSMAALVRQRLEAEEKPIDQLEVFLGHRVIDEVSELYAPFSPTYLRSVKRHIEAIIDELEKLAPGAFHHSLTTDNDNVVQLQAA
jgi:hypothetical protein